jgi:hypothetical protein
MGDNAVRFVAYEASSVRIWLYRAGGTACYNWAVWRFDHRNKQSEIYTADADGMFAYVAGGCGLPDGDYELHVAPASVKSEPAKCRQIHFRLSTEDGEQFCELTGDFAAPPEIGATAPITPATIAAAIKTMPTWPEGPPPGSTMALAMYSGAKSPEPTPVGPILEFEGRIRSIADWAREKGLNPLEIYARLARGCSIEQALAAPAQKSDNGPFGDRAGRAIELD